MNWKNLWTRLIDRRKQPARPRALIGQLNIDYLSSPNTKQFPFFANNIVDWKANFTRPANSGKVGVYYSLGEVRPDDSYLPAIQAAGIQLIGRNPTWGGQYIDVRNMRWCDILIELLRKSYATGKFDFCFLDTADTYWALDPLIPGHLDEFIKSTAMIVNRIKAAFPTKGIIINRGFEAYPQCKNSLSGFLFEGLFRNSDGTGPQAPDKTEKLLALSRLIKAFGTPIYIIDFCQPSELSLADATATRIRQAGFIPLVTTYDLEGKVLAS